MSQYKSEYTGPQIDEAVRNALNFKTADDLVNYYLKNETYTKTEVQNLISAISTLNIEIVAFLPTTGNPTTIYLTPNSSSGDNIYDEYLYANGTWEIIGSTQMDVSNFATKDKYGDTAISLGRRTDTGSVGTNSVATGDRTQANGNYSVAMGSLAQANAMAAVALGREVRANGSYSVALGEGTITKRQGSIAVGTWNVEDTSGELVHTVGNGTSSSARSNAHTVDISGNAWYQGDVYVGSTSE